MSRRSIFFIISVTGFIIFFTASFCAERSIADIVKDTGLPFEAEELVYNVSWSKFIRAGSANLSLTAATYKEGIPVMSAKAVARSAKWMRIFGIDVEDTIETFFDKSYRFSYFFQAEIKETDYKKTKSITFDWNTNQIDYIEREILSHYELKGETHDVLSALYYVRSLPLKPEGSFFVPVFDDGKEYLLEIRVMDKETLRIKGLEISTLKTKVLLKTKGIFNRKGDVFIWFSDDLRKIPVQMQCDIFLGFFHVELLNPENFFYFR